MHIVDIEKEVVNWTRKLVKIPSENGIDLEDAVLEEILPKMRDIGATIDVFPLSRGRRNCISSFGITSKTKEILLFSGHMDTVKGYRANNSLSAPLKNGKLFGRGTSDMKGALACFIVAISKIIKEFPPSSWVEERGITFGFTVDEETGCQGVYGFEDTNAMQVFKKCILCILGEPTKLQPIIGHKGISWYIAEFQGKAAHASVPQLGNNAIYKAARFTMEMERRAKVVAKKESEMGSATLNVGTIQGGEATNIVPKKCAVTVDRRFVVGEDPSEEEEELRQIAKNIDQNCLLKTGSPGHPYSLPKGTENSHYKSLNKICADFGLTGNDCYLSGYTEADVYYRKYGIPTIILGPGSIEQAHQTPEFIEVQQLVDGVKIYHSIMEKFLTGNLLY